eukprot:470724-Rhodomonas_salina.1
MYSDCGVTSKFVQKSQPLGPEARPKRCKLCRVSLLYNVFFEKKMVEKPATNTGNINNTGPAFNLQGTAVHVYRDFPPASGSLG